MKRKALSITFVALLAVNTSLAVPDVKIEVQCENVLLSWPSCDTNNEYYLIQHRAALDPTNQWETIASWVPADFGTNRTHYVHTGAVLNPPCQNAAGGMAALSATTLSYTQIVTPPQPMVIRADGVGSATPLAIYPPGYDLSPFLILDPASGESFSGMGLTARSFSILDSIDPGSGGIGEGSSITDPPGTGFYRVVRHGVTVVGLTNGMTLSGTVKLRVEAGNDYGRLSSISINENGVPVSDISIAEAPFDLPLTISVNTMEMSNGLHVISATGSWYVPGANNPYVAFDTEPVTINVFNEISFPNWMPRFGQVEDTLYVTAQSAHADADWYVDVYGAEAGYIGTLGGHTTNGTIEVIWNLIGPDYQSYAEESSFQFVVETVFDDEQSTNSEPEPQALSAASATTPYTRKNRDRWAAPGDWVVANQTFWGTWNGGDNLDMMTDAFANLGRSLGRAVRPVTSSGEAFRIVYGDSTETVSWQTFRQALYHPYSRNLFYSGHGAGHGIGFDEENPNVFVTREEIESMLHTNPGNTNRHGFRFVFIDGCETAQGHLPEAFGIIREENLSLDHYLKSGERLSAYVGWNKSPTAAFYWGKVVYPGHWIFVQNFLYNWTTGTWASVRDALDHSGFGPLGNSSISPAKLTVFGYKDLGVNQENAR